MTWQVMHIRTSILYIDFNSDCRVLWLESLLMFVPGQKVSGESFT